MEISIWYTFRGLLAPFLDHSPDADRRQLVLRARPGTHDPLLIVVSVGSIPLRIPRPMRRSIEALAHEEGISAGAA